MQGSMHAKLHFLTPLWDATRCRWLIGVSPLVNPLYTEFHFPEVFLRLLELCMIHISTSVSQHWKLELRILPSSLSRFMTSAMPTHQRAYNDQGSLTSELFSRLKAVYEMEPLKRLEEPFLHPFALKRREMAQPQRLFYSQPRQPPPNVHLLIFKPPVLSHHMCMLPHLH